MEALGESAYQYALSEVGKMYEDIPDGKKLLEKITVSFQKTYNNPPIADFENILQKNFTIHEVRCALFRPSVEQVRYYPAILHVTNHLPEERLLEHRSRSIIISLIYLVHRNKWSFLEEFVIRGGMDAIASRVNDSNLYNRGQIFEILLSITDCDSFDWFQQSDGDVTRRTLHHRLFSLSDNTFFLSGLLANRSLSYPGGSFRALQLLAFWISWVRAMMTTNQRLKLSDPMLKEIQLWSQGSEDNVIEEEITLAKTIFQDFSKDQFNDGQDFTNDAANSSSFGIGKADITVVEETIVNPNLNDHVRDKDAFIFISGCQKLDTKGILLEDLPSSSQIKQMLNKSNDTSTSKSDADKVQSDVDIVKLSPEITAPSDKKLLHSSILLQVKTLKEEGNFQFKLSQLDLSHTTYTKALNMIDNELNDHSSSSRCFYENGSKCENQENNEFFEEIKTLKASLFFNIAMILWKLFENKENNLNSKNEVYLEDLLACENAVKSCLLIDPQHIKALYRLCEILLKSERSHEALKIIEEYSIVKGLPEQLKAVRRRCLATLMIQKERKDDNTNHVNSNLNVNNNSKLEPLSDDMQGINEVDGAVGVQKRAEMAASIVGDRAAKVLKALQARKHREGERTTHAWNGWTAPIFTPNESEGVAQVPIEVEGILDDNEDSNANKINDKNDDNEYCRLFRDNEIKCPILDENTMIDETKIESSKIDSKSVPPMLKTKTLSIKNMNIKDIKKCFIPSSIVLESFNQLKRLSITFFSLCKICHNDDAGDHEATWDNMDSIVQEALEMLKNIWKEKITLKKLMAASIEEELLHLLLTVAIKYTKDDDDTDIKDHSGNANNTNTSRKLLYQVGLLDRFQTVLQLTLYGNPNLKKSLSEAIELIVTSSRKSEKESLSNKDQENIIEITPNNSYHKSIEVILKIQEMIIS